MRWGVVVSTVCLACCAKPRPHVVPTDPAPSVSFYEPSIFAYVPDENTGEPIVDCTPELVDHGIVFRLPARVVVADGDTLRLPMCGRHKLRETPPERLRVSLRQGETGEEFASFLGPDDEAKEVVFNYDLAPLLADAPRSTVTYDVALFRGGETSVVRTVRIVWP